MKGKKHRPGQIIKKLREAEAMIAAGKTIGQVVQSLEISEQTFHRWQNQYGGIEGRGSEAAEGTRRREQASEEAAGRSGTGQGDLEGSLGGKLLSPARRRQAVEHVQQRQNVSQRRACRVLGQSRGTQRYRARSDSQEEQRLVTRMHELVRQYPFPSISAAITAPSLSPRRSVVMAKRLAWRCCTLSPARRGRMAMPNRSLAGYATSC